MTVRSIAAAWMFVLASTAAFAQTPQQPPAQPPAKPEEPPVYEEQVVVTASGNFSVSDVDDAFYQDVLDARFAGPTEAYTQVNGAFGVKFSNDHLQTTIKVINLLNEDIQSHVFGDILKRQVIGEIRVTFEAALRVDVAAPGGVDPEGRSG